MKEIKLIITDLDGTLATIPIKWQLFFEEVYQAVGIKTDRVLWNTLENLSKKARNKVFNIWNKYELEALDSVDINLKALNYLKELHKQGKRIVLVTMQGKSFTKRILNDYQLDMIIDDYITREDCFNRELQLRRMILRYEVFPEETLFMGDRRNDKISAEKVGCKFIDIKELNYNEEKEN